MRTLLTLIVATTAITSGSAQELLLDINTQLALDKPVPEPRELATVDNITYFTAHAFTLPEGRELWRTDGTSIGTSIVADIEPGIGSGDPREIVDLGNGTLIFSAVTDLGRELWRSDGTAAGTTLVKDIAPGPDSSGPTELALYNGRVYFFADDGVLGAELWSTDGTNAGTLLEADLIPGGLGKVGRIVATPTRLYVASRTPGANSTFTLYAETPTQPFERIFDQGLFASILDSLDFVAFGNDMLYFRGGDEPWISDGTSEGTYAVCECDFAQSAVAAGNSVFFIASTPTTGYELWTTDGSEIGTYLVEDLDPGVDSGGLGADLLALDDGVVALTAYRPDVTDAVFIADANSVSLFYDVPTSANVQLISEFGDGFVFATSGSPGTLFIANTVFNTVATLGDNYGSFVSSAINDDMLLLSLDRDDNGDALVVTDGTFAGTQRLDIAPHDTMSSNPSPPVPAGDLSYFFATTPGEGRELWVTDGTAVGTRLVSDVTPGPASSVVGNPTIVPLGSRVVFMVDAPFDAAPHVSDGTEAGTFALAPSSTATLSSDVVAFDEGAYFFHADTTSGRQLWKTDGTVVGTQLAAKMNANGISQGSLTPIGDRLYFTVLAGSGREPWVTDGTQAGTTLLADIIPGTGSSDPEGFTAFGDVVVFSADAPGIGREVWKTDGTPGGTSLALDVFLDGSSEAEDFIVAGNRLVFTAFTALNESEIVSTDATFTAFDVLHDWQVPNGGQMVSLGDQVVFAQTVGTNKGVYKTDGTIGGTEQIISDVTAWPLTLLGQPGSDERVVFSAFMPPYGTFFPTQSLWVTDGTAAGTTLVSPVTAVPLNLGRVGNRTVFSDDTVLHGRELVTIPLSDTGAYVAEVIGAGCVGSTGVPEMSTSGAASTGELFSINLDGARPNALSYLAVSTSTGSFSPDGCALIPDPPLLFPFATNASGELSIPFVPDASFVGVRLIAQWATLDPVGSFVNKASLSPALEVVFGP